MNVFCAKKKATMMGRVKTVAAAMSWFQMMVFCPWKSCKPSAMVKLRGELRNSKGPVKSFQA